MEHQAIPNPKPKRVLKAPKIDKASPWGFFDGASQGEPPFGGVGGILYLNDSTKFEITFAPGQDTKNKAELVAPWSVLQLELKKQVQNLKLFANSKMTIYWENKKIHINSPHLQHLLKTLSEQMAAFESITFHHIYKELNSEVDKLSKMALALPPGLMEVKEIVNSQTMNHFL